MYIVVTAVNNAVNDLKFVMRVDLAFSLAYENNLSMCDESVSSIVVIISQHISNNHIVHLKYI